MKAAVDDEIMDEQAGAARAELAASHKAKQEAEQERLRKENASFFSKMRHTGAKVDDDITDDVAGQAREGYDIHFRGGRKSATDGRKSVADDD